MVSIHAPRVGRDCGAVQCCALRCVSIHAPRVGRDSISDKSNHGARCFNSRAPRGARLPSRTYRRSSRVFQFTRPAWGATTADGIGALTNEFQFTRPAWGATSQTALRDSCRRGFNSRAPRGARPVSLPQITSIGVSIHAPRVGRDGDKGHGTQWHMVSIHAPRVGRDVWPSAADPDLQFQFTRPAWGATHFSTTKGDETMFQFTRPAWGATRAFVSLSTIKGFQFTRPAWGATSPCAFVNPLRAVSIHAPRVGRDPGGGQSCVCAMFQFTRPAWGATN